MLNSCFITPSYILSHTPVLEKLFLFSYEYKGPCNKNGKTEKLKTSRKGERTSTIYQLTKLKMQTHEQIKNPTRSKYSRAKLSKNICYLISFTKNVSHGRML